MEISILWSLQKAYMPLVVTYGKVEALCFLIDTGATHNVLFSHVYEGLKKELGDEFTEVFKKTIEEKQHIMGIEGSRTETPIVEATFNIEGIDYTSTFVYLTTLTRMQWNKYKKKQEYKFTEYLEYNS